MVESLKSFSPEMVERAFEQLRLHPPSGYHGMPAEVDVIAAIRKLEDQDQAESQRKQDMAAIKEIEDLKRRKAAGEEFFTLADVILEARAKYGDRIPVGGIDQMVKSMPNVTEEEIENAGL